MKKRYQHWNALLVGIPLIVNTDKWKGNISICIVLTAQKVKSVTKIEMPTHIFVLNEKCSRPHLPYNFSVWTQNTFINQHPNDTSTPQPNRPKIQSRLRPLSASNQSVQPQLVYPIRPSLNNNNRLLPRLHPFLESKSKKRSWTRSYIPVYIYIRRIEAPKEPTSITRG